MLSITALLAACAIMTFSSVQGAIDESQHTRCFNYYYNKDNCVSASDEAKCRGSALAYTSAGTNIRRLTTKKASALVRRYDTPDESVKWIAAGSGICSAYETQSDIGACLWSGTKGTGNDPKNAGWLNGSQRHACGQQLYVQRQGKPGTVQYMKVLDGCDFGTTEPAEGCPQIYLTEAAFALFADKDEWKQGHLNGAITWDFNNLQHTKPGNSPI